MPTMAMMAGTGLTTATAHPFCLFVDSTDVIKQPSTAGSSFGTPIESITLHEVMGQAPTLEFTTDDPQGTFTPTPGADVYFCDHHALNREAGDGTKIITDDLFRGIITSRELVPGALGGSPARQWHIVATGLEILLDRRIVPSGLFANGTLVNDAIQLLMAYYGDPRISFLSDDLTAINSGATAGTGHLINGGTLRTNVTLSGKTVRQILEEILRADSSFDYQNSINRFYMMVNVDPQGRLRGPSPSDGFTPWYNIKEGTGALSGQYRTHAAPSDIQVDRDTTNLINAVYVRGVDAASSGWVYDRDSISSNGRYEAFLDAPLAIDSTSNGTIGNAFLSDHNPNNRIRFRLSDTHDNLYAIPQADVSGGSHRGWHVRNFSTLFSSSGYWTDGAIYVLAEVTQRWSGGGNHTELDLSYSGAAKSVGSLLYQRDTESLQSSRAGTRLAGTLGEVAVRVKAGQPVDSDFDSARDGFIVVDTTNSVLWIRVNGAWQISNVIIPGANALILGGDVELRRSATKTLTIDTDGALGPLTAVQLAGATPLEFSTDAFIRRSAAKTLTLDSDGAGTTLTAIDAKGAFLRGFSGSAFPASPATNDQFYRTDLSGWYFWNGTRWLSSTLYQYPLGIGDAVLPEAATIIVSRTQIPLAGVSDLWLENYQAAFFVSGGTALDASNKWVCVLSKNPAATTVGTINIASGASSAWRNSGQVAINALVGTTNFGFDITATKTGTPGNLYFMATVTYRVVAT